MIDTRPHRHGHLNSFRDNEPRKGDRKAKNWRIREAADAKKSHFFLIFPSPYLSTYSRYIPDTFPTHTRYIRISHEYSPNNPRISHEYPKAPPKMIETNFFSYSTRKNLVMSGKNSTFAGESDLHYQNYRRFRGVRYKYYRRL